MALDPISAGLDLATALIERLWADPAQRDAAKLELLKLQQSGDLAQMTAQAGLLQGQLDTNKAEASSGNMFVAGWRPAIGWVCASALAFQYLVRPLAAAALDASHLAVTIPGLDDNLWQLLMGMLGLGGLRTFEKVKGVAASAAPLAR